MVNTIFKKRFLLYICFNFPLIILSTHLKHQDSGVNRICHCDAGRFKCIGMQSPTLPNSIYHSWHNLQDSVHSAKRKSSVHGKY